MMAKLQVYMRRSATDIIVLKYTLQYCYNRYDDNQRESLKLGFEILLYERVRLCSGNLLL